MGHQFYMTRVVLGRSAYEPLERRPDEDEARQAARASAVEATAGGSYNPGPEGYVQRYDRRGYPENLASRLLSRQFRRAQNDILASVGVCVDERATGSSVPTQFARKHPSGEKSKIKLIRRENETGLSIAAADLGLFCLTNVFILGLRHRMQAFRFYTGVPFVEIFKTEWKHFGFWQFFFAGAPATLLYLALDMSQAYLINSAYNLFSLYIVRKIKSRKRRDNARMAMNWIDYILRAAVFILITPLEIFASLQRLGLVPSRPFFPNPMALIPFTSWSPIQAHNISQSSGLNYCVRQLASLAFSPLGYWWMLFHAKSQVDQKLYAYMRIGLPKPDYPDVHSWKGAREDGMNNDTIPGLGLTRDLSDFVDYKPANLYGEIKKDILEVIAGFRHVLSKWKTKGQVEEKAEDEADFEEPPLVPTTDVPTPSIPNSPENLGPSSGRTPISQMPPLPDWLRPTNDEIPFRYLHENRDQILGPISNNYSTLRSDSSSIDPQSVVPQEVDNPIPQIALPTTNSPHVRASIEISNISPPAISPTAEHVEPNNSSHLNTRATSNPSPPRSHHVTALTAHFADAMGCHLSTHLANLLFLPLEALFIRSIAIGFLSTPAATHSPVAVALRNQVFPPGAWFGMGLHGGARAMLDYAGKMALCASLDVCVGYVVWQIGASVAWWAGGRWFRWGRL